MTAPGDPGTRAARRPRADGIEYADTELGGHARLYRRSTVYLTSTQSDWVRSIVDAAEEDRVPLSASDVVRLALDQLRENAHDLRTRLITHAREESLSHPGRVKRGLPRAIDSVRVKGG